LTFEIFLCNLSLCYACQYVFMVQATATAAAAGAAAAATAAAATTAATAAATAAEVVRVRYD